MESKPTPLKPIDIKKSRFDLESYYGRLRHFITITSPLTLFNSNDEIRKAQKLLKDYDAGSRPDLDLSEASQEQVWAAKQVVEASLHPDTQEPIPLPFRMSAFVPTNLIIATGLLLPNPSMVSIIGWQWANQTLNVCVNYSNANKSTGMSTEEVAKAYLSATATSVGLAVGLNRMVPRLAARFGRDTGLLLARFVPFVAVASAGCVNVGLMRWKEIRDGIDIFPPGVTDPDQALGKSRIAGAYAVGQTAASRVLTNIPTLILPPLIITALQKRGTFSGPRGKSFEMIANLGLIGGSLFFFLPPAIAAFPQRARISPHQLEDQFSDVIDSTGKPFEHFEFNKGL
ncbi:hypothetical protein MJO28_008557 [Puccinia striiformis f. sp. tritici]|uniref:Sidoreflexin n=3 Tax=Puccinia striiformis TaxID=27350 RepID=A0A0L0VKX9_9BASI|nr:hypothetical protein MJO28_008557 [Puccinia striiformis f. sp. tritici]KAI7952821.1 hypothetical protein MJO29_008452 [Puccinia striiformis f. sp. tritici]KNE99871.1 hypothetical protein PSTG_06961 [Puccinia striiformis f. sp. tritici PST-78]POW00367.1 hypothetical protein PSTT_13177 [Puccinia striiformis]